MSLQQVINGLKEANVGTFNVSLDFWRHDHFNLGVKNKEELTWEIYILNGQKRYEGATLESAYERWLDSRQQPQITEADESLKEVL